MDHIVRKYRGRTNTVTHVFSDASILPEPERTKVMLLDACDKHSIPGIGRRFTNDEPAGQYEYYLLDSEQQPT